MKLGKQPKRFGGPSQKFLDRQQAQLPKELPASYDKDDIKLYLDDERSCPKGWLLAKDPRAFFTLLSDEEIIKNTIYISLDWYLGVGATGVDVSRRLVKKFMDDPSFMSKLEMISFHSSDHLKAREMFDIFRDNLPKERLGDIYLNVGAFVG